MRQDLSANAYGATHREVDYNNALIVISSSNDAADIERCPVIYLSPSDLTTAVEQVAQVGMYAPAEWYRSSGERVRFVRLWSLLALNLPTPSPHRPFLRPNSVCGIRDRYILRSTEPFSSFFIRRTRRTAQWRAVLPGPIGEQGVVNEPPPLVPSTPGPSGGAHAYGLLLAPKYRPDTYPLSLRADKRERPEPSWPLDVPALYTRYVQYVALVEPLRHAGPISEVARRSDSKLILPFLSIKPPAGVCPFNPFASFIESYLFFDAIPRRRTEEAMIREFVMKKIIFIKTLV